MFYLTMINFQVIFILYNIIYYIIIYYKKNLKVDQSFSSFTKNKFYKTGKDGILSICGHFSPFNFLSLILSTNLSVSVLVIK